MTGPLPHKTKQFFFVLIKLSIVTGAFYFIYNKLTKNQDLNFNDFIRFLTENESFSIKSIIFLLFLTIFNWFFEILKWHYLVCPVKIITLKSALEQSLGALTASLFTPNRIGEYGAKAIYFLPAHRKRIVLLNLLGNMMQMSVTVFFGIFGLIFFVSQYAIEINYFKVASFAIVMLLIISFIGIGAKKASLTIKGISIEKIILFIKNLSLKTHIYSFSFSVFRYLIFSFQFYYLLLILGLDISYLDAMIVITSMYLLSSIIPSIFIFDVIIKGSIAVYLFSFVGVNEFIILSIVMVMWLFNFVLPSLFGSFYVLNFNLPKNDED
jgi:hypothetical protein